MSCGNEATDVRAAIRGRGRRVGRADTAIRADGGGRTRRRTHGDGETYGGGHANVGGWMREREREERRERVCKRCRTMRVETSRGQPDREEVRNGTRTPVRGAPCLRGVLPSPPAGGSCSITPCLQRCKSQQFCNRSHVYLIGTSSAAPYYEYYRTL